MQLGHRKLGYDVKGGYRGGYDQVVGSSRTYVVRRKLGTQESRQNLADSDEVNDQDVGT